jgi:hypothetical protein
VNDMERELKVCVEPVVAETVTDAANDLVVLRRAKSRLAGPAYVWERHAAASCDGNCAEPRIIAVDVSGTQPLTCCEMRVAHVRLSIVRRVERSLRARILQLIQGVSAKQPALAIVTLMLAGCAAAPAAHDGSMVRQIRGEDTQACEFLGVVTGEGNDASTASAAAAAKQRLRAAVEAKGGNAVVVVDERAAMSDQYKVGDVIAAGHGEAVVTGEAYRCVYNGAPVSTQQANSSSETRT